MLSSISLPAVEPCQPSVVTVFSEDFKRHRPKVPMAQRKPKRRLAWTSHNFFHSFLTTKHGCTWSTSHRLGEKDSLIPCLFMPQLLTHKDFCSLQKALFATVDVQARVGAREKNAAHVSPLVSTRSGPKLRRARRHLAADIDEEIAREFKVSGDRGTRLLLTQG